MVDSAQAPGAEMGTADQASGVATCGGADGARTGVHRFHRLAYDLRPLFVQEG
ncbi:MAG: hypothetical protein LAO51_07605 [Acidobacteriia bacterium]|nr:hypothetical protein [Terriglobia bacterium]